MLIQFNLMAEKMGLGFMNLEQLLILKVVQLNKKHISLSNVLLEIYVPSFKESLIVTEAIWIAIMMEMIRLAN